MSREPLSIRVRAATSEARSMGPGLWRPDGPARERLRDAWFRVAPECESAGAERYVDVVNECLDKGCSWSRFIAAVDLLIAYLEGYETGNGPE